MPLSQREYEFYKAMERIFPEAHDYEDVYDFFLHNTNYLDYPGAESSLRRNWEDYQKFKREERKHQQAVLEQRVSNTRVLPRGWWQYY